MSREMQLILDGREKLPGDVGVGVVVDAGRENVKHFLPENLLAGPDVPDSLKKLFEVVASSGSLEQIIIHREFLDEVLTKPLRCPDAKLRAAVGFHSVADRDDDVVVVVRD